MTAQTMSLILGAVIFSATGQLLLKSGAQHLAGLARVDFLMTAARDAHVLAGLAAWIASTVCWLYVLRVAPLSKAYLLSSLTYVLIPLGGMYLFGEHLRRAHIVGMVLIIVGVGMIVSGEWGVGSGERRVGSGEWGTDY